MRLKVHTWTCNACGRECETHQARPYKAQICGRCSATKKQWTPKVKNLGRSIAAKKQHARRRAERERLWQLKVQQWTKGTP